MPIKGNLPSYDETHHPNRATSLAMVEQNTFKGQSLRPKVEHISLTG